MSNVKVRFPPSPTGYCHVGTARMAIVNYLFAKKHNGMIYFRSEDTDKERSKLEYEEDIKEQLLWLGLGWDDFSRSTELVGRHTAAMQKLVDEDKAYISEEPSKNDPSKTVQVVRLRNAGTVVTFNDVIRGDITFDTSELKDFVIGRAIDDPLYNFAVVVDDAAQGITHVIRGEDHISNTPRQILIQEALGYPRPVYAHYPLHLGSDRSKLSKRTGDVAVRSYREKGYLPEALLNYIAVLGWTPPSGREVLNLEEMIAEFDLKDLHKSGAVFDVEKLRWYNREYLLTMRDDDFKAEALRRFEDAIVKRALPWDENIAHKLMPLIRERVSVWEDIDTLSGEGEFDFFFSDPQLVVVDIPQKKVSVADTERHLTKVAQLLQELPDADFSDPEKIKATVWAYAEQEGRGNVLWPLRYSLSGRAKSPDPFMIASIVGKEAVLRRIQTAVDVLGKTAQ
jgi:glutamyl-tRNA synthetase